MADILTQVNKINLQGDPSADLTINCESERFRVHKGLISLKSPVFSAMLNCDMKEAKEGVINIREMNPNTLSSMIHFVYTETLAQGWQELDTEDVVKAADMYDMPEWIKLFSEART